MISVNPKKPLNMSERYWENRQIFDFIRWISVSASTGLKRGNTVWGTLKLNLSVKHRFFPMTPVNLEENHSGNIQLTRSSQQHIVMVMGKAQVFIRTCRAASIQSRFVNCFPLDPWSQFSGSLKCVQLPKQLLLPFKSSRWGRESHKLPNKLCN